MSDQLSQGTTIILCVDLSGELQEKALTQTFIFLYAWVHAGRHARFREEGAVYFNVYARLIDSGARSGQVHAKCSSRVTQYDGVERRIFRCKQMLGLGWPHLENPAIKHAQMSQN